MHCDLKDPDAGVGGGPSRIAMQWTGEEATRIKGILDAPEAYPFGNLYRYWPGPNSNSFVAWVLGRASIQYALHWRGIGGKWRA